MSQNSPKWPVTVFTPSTGAFIHCRGKRHSVSGACNKECRLSHSASLFNPGSHVCFTLFLCVLPSVHPTLHTAGWIYPRFTKLTQHCSYCHARRTCWIMQMDTERQSSLETNKLLCALGEQNHCILFWKTSQRMLTAFWFCHRETEQKQIVTDLYSHVYLPFILNNDTLTYSTPFTLTFSPLLPHLVFYYGGPELPKSKIKK